MPLLTRLALHLEHPFLDFAPPFRVRLILGGLSGLDELCESMKRHR
jgi:hypothetical protein